MICQLTGSALFAGQAPRRFAVWPTLRQNDRGVAPDFCFSVYLNGQALCPFNLVDATNTFGGMQHQAQKLSIFGVTSNRRVP